MIRNNQARKILQSAAFSAGLLLMTVPAAMAQDLCAGLNPSEAPYAACVRSLDLDSQPQLNESAASRNLRATLWNEENISTR